MIPYGYSGIETFVPMRGKTFRNEEMGASDYIITEKIDGVRRLFVKTNGRTKLYSRHGIEDFKFPLLCEYVNKLLIDGDVLDTEFYDDSRERTISILNSKQLDGDSYGINVYAFDLFRGCCKDNPAIERRRLLEHIFKTEILIKAIPVLEVTNDLSKIIEWKDKIVDEKGEGVMALLGTSKYVYDKKTPQNTLLKFKKVFELVGRIDNIYLGKNRLANKIGAVGVSFKIDGKDGFVKVGSGIADCFRNIEETPIRIGAYAEIEFFYASDIRGQLTLIHPVFKRVCEEG